MARNGSGTDSVANTFVTGTIISSSAVNANHADHANEITNSLPRDGQAAMTGPLKAIAGSEAAPGIAFGVDTNLGIRRVGADHMALVTGGTDRLEIDSAGNSTINGLLKAVGGIAIGTASVAVTTAGVNMIGAADAAAQAALLGVGESDSPEFTAATLGGAAVLTALTGLRTVAMQQFTSTGTYTPTTGMKYCILLASGGGGGGGGADGTDTDSLAGAGGGGAGGTVIAVLSAATVGASQAITIGAAGAAGSNSGGDGGTGGNTTVGALITAVGGNGGAGRQTGSVQIGLGGANTTQTGDYINIGGGAGGAGGNNSHAESTTVSASGGAGGASFWGGGGRGGATISAASVAGTAGTAPGAGGGGACSRDTTSGAAGGAGAAGIVVVFEFT